MECDGVIKNNNTDSNTVFVEQSKAEKLCQVEKADDEQNVKYQKYNQEQADIQSLCVEATRLEYEYAFRRAERLDNKVYILLTVCAFIFVLLTTAINKLSGIDVFAFRQSFLIAAYDIILILSIAGTLGLLITLIRSLSGKDFMRYDTFNILERNLLSQNDGKTIAKYMIIKYEIAREHNNKIVSRQFKLLNKAVTLLTIVVSLLILLAVIGNFIPEKSNVDVRTTAINNHAVSRVIKESSFSDDTDDLVMEYRHRCRTE